MHVLGSVSSTRGGAVGGFAGVGVGVGVGVGAGGAVGLVRAGAGRAGRARRGSCEGGGGNASSGRGRGGLAGEAKPSHPSLEAVSRTQFRKTVGKTLKNDTKNDKTANKVTSPHLGRALWSPRATADVVCCSDV